MHPVHDFVQRCRDFQCLSWGMHWKRKSLQLPLETCRSPAHPTASSPLCLHASWRFSREQQLQEGTSHPTAKKVTAEFLHCEFNTTHSSSCHLRLRDVLLLKSHLDIVHHRRVEQHRVLVDSTDPMCVIPSWIIITQLMVIDRQRPCRRRDLCAQGCPLPTHPCLHTQVFTTIHRLHPTMPLPTSRHVRAVHTMGAAQVQSLTPTPLKHFGPLNRGVGWGGGWGA